MASLDLPTQLDILDRLHARVGPPLTIQALRDQARQLVTQHGLTVDEVQMDEVVQQMWVARGLAKPAASALAVWPAAVPAPATPVSVQITPACAAYDPALDWGRPSTRPELHERQAQLAAEYAPMAHLANQFFTVKAGLAYGATMGTLSALFVGTIFLLADVNPFTHGWFWMGAVTLSSLVMLWMGRDGHRAQQAWAKAGVTREQYLANLTAREALAPNTLFNDQQLADLLKNYPTTAAYVRLCLSSPVGLLQGDAERLQQVAWAWNEDPSLQLKALLDAPVPASAEVST